MRKRISKRKKLIFLTKSVRLDEWVESGGRGRGEEGERKEDGKGMEAGKAAIGLRVVILMVMMIISVNFFL